MKKTIPYTLRPMPFSKGFTLLELLVVISIIGILMAVALASFTDAQRKARDTRRAADVKAFQNVYEQYHAVNGGYGTQQLMQTGFAGGTEPTDPKTGSGYSVDIDTALQTYCVCAGVEDDQNGNSTSSCSGIGGADTDFYCARNLQ